MDVALQGRTMEVKKLLGVTDFVSTWVGAWTFFV